MDTVLELIVWVSVYAIYGTNEKPRHPVWRNSARVIAFGGVGVSVAQELKLLGDISFPMAVIIGWLMCVLIVFLAECYFASKRIFIAVYTVFPTWLVFMLFAKDII